MTSDAQERLDKFIRKPRRALLVVALPMMAGFSFHAVYSFVDYAYIGMLGEKALAAATFVGAIFFVAIAFTNGLIKAT